MPEVWSTLKFMPADSIDAFIERFAINNIQILSDLSKIKILKSLIKKLIGRE